MNQSAVTIYTSINWYTILTSFFYTVKIFFNLFIRNFIWREYPALNAVTAPQNGRRREKNEIPVRNHPDATKHKGAINIAPAYYLNHKPIRISDRARCGEKSGEI